MGTSTKPECCYDIPLLESLGSLLNCDSVIEQVCCIYIIILCHACLEYSIDTMYCTCTTQSCIYKYVIQVFKPHFESRGIVGDFCDGPMYKTHPLFSKDAHSLQVLLYCDDVEVCNPLSSASKLHKLGKLVHSIHVYNAYM